MSATPFEQLANLDRLVHDPARLAILTALSACERADFLFLQRITGLSKGNLSSHLSKLEEAGLVEIEKRFVEKKTQTLVRLSDPGGRRGRELLEGDGGAARERRPLAAAERGAGAFDGVGRLQGVVDKRGGMPLQGLNTRRRPISFGVKGVAPAARLAFVRTPREGAALPLGWRV